MKPGDKVRKALPEDVGKSIEKQREGKGMTPEEIIRRCDRQIELAGDTASVGFRISGRWGKTDTRRLWKNGPAGEIVNDFGDGTIYVMFSAVEVKKAVQKILDESTVYGNDCPTGKCEM